jgi:RNA polymerase sigma factor (TIGR02999 family)
MGKDTGHAGSCWFAQEKPAGKVSAAQKQADGRAPGPAAPMSPPDMRGVSCVQAAPARAVAHGGRAHPSSTIDTLLLLGRQVSLQTEVFDPGQVTQWLSALDVIEPQTANRLFELLYDDLRRMARGHMRRESPDHTLSATALAHEAWFRLAEQTRTQWKNRSHFMAVASTMMRRILVNHELARRASKRDADLVAVTLSGMELLGVPPDRDLVAVHESLLAFETIDARAAKVVELRFFGGLENEEIAEALGISLATVKRDWTLARAWLHRELGGGSA